MRFLHLLSLIFLISTSVTRADQEIELEIKPAYELSFQMEEGKYYLFQRSLDMENWSTSIFEGSDRQFELARSFRNPQEFYRVIETTTPPESTAPPNVVGKRIELKEFVFNFPNPGGYQTVEELSFQTNTSGQKTLVSDSSTSSITYGFFKQTYTSAIILITNTDGSVEEIHFSFESATTGFFSRQTQVNGQVVSFDFGDFEIADLPS